MAYQQVSTPRFYINVVEWLHYSGYLDMPHTSLHTLPVLQNDVVADTGGTFTAAFNFTATGLPSTENSNKGFIALLGHTLGSHVNDGQELYLMVYGANTLTGIVNTGVGFPYMVFGNGDGTNGYEIKNGFSIIKCDTNSSGIAGLTFYSNQATIGSLVCGTYYDVPQSPNLNLTMNIEYGGTKEITTYNGSSFSNTMWDRQPMWGELGAWELYSPDIEVSGRTQQLARSGRKTWQLTFSYMDDADLWGSVHVVDQGPYTSELSDGWDSDDLESDGLTLKYNLLNDDSFYAQVWHRTLNGSLPFIFQPNNLDNTNFVIARFRSNTLKVTQSAFNVYDISVTIEETW